MRCVGVGLDADLHNDRFFCPVCGERVVVLFDQASETRTVTVHDDPDQEESLWDRLRG